MVPGRVAGDVLQCADAADTHVMLRAAKLLQRPGVAAGHLPGAGQRQAPRGDYQRAGGEQPGTNCQHPAARGVPGRRGTWLPGRAGIMVREPVAGRP